MLSDINLLNFVFVFGCIWTIMIMSEALTRFGILHGEVARKSMHILGGIVMATTPLYMNKTEIIVLNIIILIGFLILSGWLHWFKALEVKRWTLGQFIFPIGVIATALVYDTGAVFAFSVLVLALADGFAAIIGKWHGSVHYHIFGADKTVLGSFTFFLIAATLFGTYMVLHGTMSLSNIGLIFVGATVVAAFEGMIAGGFDNLAVPLVAGAILTQL